MIGHAVVIGGSIAGLTAGIGLARHGWQVTIIERDPTAPVESGDEAFTAWRRPGVPQWQQGHTFAARARNLLAAQIPEVLERLESDGVETFNPFRALAPEHLWNDEDDAFGWLWTRRPGFELALRRTAEAEPGIDLRSPAAVAGLQYDSLTAIPRITGVGLADGELLVADLVIDCAGRRTPVPGWLHADLGVVVDQESQPCDLVYYSRYYRQLPGSELPPLSLLGLTGELDGMGFGAFTGDHHTFGLVFNALPDDTEARVLRHAWAFDTLAAAVPAMSSWASPEHALPLHEPSLMAGFDNVRRRLAPGGQPLVSGLIQVGDALSTTNPQYGWGASMALTGAVALVEAACCEATADDVLCAYEARIGEEVDAVYRESAASDRWRTYRWRNLEVPEWDRHAMDRQTLISEGVAAGAPHDPVLGRALLRRINLLDQPDATLDEPAVVAAAERSRSIIAAKPPRRIGPSRAERRLLFAEANPLSELSGTTTGRGEGLDGSPAHGSQG